MILENRVMGNDHMRTRGNALMIGRRISWRLVLFARTSRTALDAKSSRKLIGRRCRIRLYVNDVGCGLGRPDAPIAFSVLSRYYFPVVREDHGLAGMAHLKC